MIYFATRSKAREFAAIKGRKVSDLGSTSAKRSESPSGERVALRRWGVKVL